MSTMEAILQGQRAFGDTVSEVMAPGVVCIPESAPMTDALGAMSRYAVDAVLVLHDDGRPIGFVNARSIPHHIDRDLRAISAAASVDEPVTSVAPDADVAEVVALLRRPGVAHVLVGHAGQPPDGVVSAADLAGWAAARG